MVVLESVCHVFIACIVCLLRLSIVSAQCENGDGIGTCTPFKTVRCSSNILDINMALDRSGSMNFGIKRNAGAHSCPRLINKSNCKRQDIMRYILRIVVKQIFNMFQRPCLEYLQSQLYRESQISCSERGFTTARFNMVWWSERWKISEYPGQMLDGSTGRWGMELGDVFYLESGDLVFSRWERNNNGDMVMRDEAVDEFFHGIFLKDSYPQGDGGTQPEHGISKLADYIKNAYATYSAEQKLQATFPVFLMTDGVVHQYEQSVELIKQATTRFRDNVNNGKDPNQKPEDRVTTIGLGLTGNQELKKKQKLLYEDIGYRDRSLLDPDVDYYFDDEATANMIIREIFTQTTKDCKDCYELGDEMECVPKGDEQPEFTGQVKDKPDILPKDVRVDTGTLFAKRIDKVIKEDKFFQIGRELRRVPLDTKSCAYQYTDGGKNTFSGYTFVNYTSDGKCQCCQERSLPPSECICDIDNVHVVKKFATTIHQNSGSQVIQVTKIAGNSMISRELQAGGEKFKVIEISIDPNYDSNDGVSTNNTDDDNKDGVSTNNTDDDNNYGGDVYKPVKDIPPDIPPDQDDGDRNPAVPTPSPTGSAIHGYTLSIYVIVAYIGMLLIV